MYKNKNRQRQERKESQGKAVAPLKYELTGRKYRKKAHPNVFVYETPSEAE